MSKEPDRRPVILTFVRYYLPGYKHGGPIRTIANIVEALGDEFDFRVVTSDRDATDTEQYPHLAGQDEWLAVGKANVLYLSPSQKSLRHIGCIIRKTPHDMLYLNSFFDPIFTLKPLLVHRLRPALGKRCVIAPRGEFSAGALGLKAAKKRAFLAVARTLGFHGDLIWQASSKHEAEDIARTMGAVAADIRVVVNLPAPVDKRAALTHRPRVEGDALRVVFLSRISPMKNLDFALEALKQVRPPVSFAIYGQVGDQAYWARCRALIADMPGNISVHYHGGVEHHEVPATLARYDLFFLPTRGENYGHAIAESFAAGTPVLISDATPWRNLSDAGVGWDLPLGKPEIFATAIDSFAQLSQEQLALIRKKSLAFAERRGIDARTLEANRALFANTGDVQ